MFDRVVMNVIQMIAIILVVSNPMLPITALSDASFLFPKAAWRDDLSVWDRSREMRFDQPPACGIIMIIWRHLPDAMEVFR